MKEMKRYFVEGSEVSEFGIRWYECSSVQYGCSSPFGVLRLALRSQFLSSLVAVVYETGMFWPVGDTSCVFRFSLGQPDLDKTTVRSTHRDS